MNFFKRGLFALLTISVILSACTYSKVVSPKQRDYPLRSASQIKVSYQTWSGMHRVGPSHADTSNLSTALTTVLKENGVDDAIESNRYDDNRLNIVLYKSHPVMSAGTRFPGMPLGMLSGFSMFILPARESHINPIEVHIINPSAEKTKRLKVYRTAWTNVNWMWGGLALFDEHNELDDRVLMGRASMARTPRENQLLFDRLEITGLKRALRPIISEALADYVPATE